MKTAWTPELLREFENDIAECFKRGEIKAPVHLSGGNEEQLIDFFTRVEHNDWVCSTWRSHYHCLLKGVPAKEVKDAILRGVSISLCFPVHRVICSALVGGIAPIAVGLAYAAKDSEEMVWCFLGDMAQRCGLVHECEQYSCGHGLPVRWILEDNGLSVATDTKAVWGTKQEPNLTGYAYKLSWPHVGVGEWVHMQ